MFHLQKNLLSRKENIKLLTLDRLPPSILRNSHLEIDLWNHLIEVKNHPIILVMGRLSLIHNSCLLYASNKFKFI
jgi:hypothetical protein